MLIGTVGWDRPDWIGSFYPENLPEDWRLSYYAARFRVVLIPADVWRQADEPTFAGWCEDGDPDFRFVVECEGRATDREHLARLSPRLLGVVLLAPAHSSELFPAEHPEPTLMWNADRDPPPVVSASLVVARSCTGEPKAQRAVLEVLAAMENDGTETCLFFDTPARALQARTIADLMGV